MIRTVISRNDYVTELQYFRAKKEEHNWNPLENPGVQSIFFRYVQNLTYAILAIAPTVNQNTYIFQYSN